MPIQITITGGNPKDTIEQVQNLAGILSQMNPSDIPVKTEVSTQPAQPPQQNSPDQTQPIQQQTPAVPTAPPQQPPAPQQEQPSQPQLQQVPTSAPSYTLEQIGQAAAQMVNAGHREKLLAWIKERGADELSKLDPSHYNDFAVFLRSLGAQI